MPSRRLVIAVLILAAVGGYALILPPRARVLPATDADGLRGAIHVHTRRSDGTGTIDEVAAAAARAGLRFVILTDHGDATRRPDAPAYVRGVLMIDAVEVSTTGGHLVALGLGQAPYPLAGEPRDVIDDIHRLGGVAIVAHPHSPRRSLRWTDWNADFDGVEWLNGDTEWRNETPLSLVRALLTYPVRHSESVASLFQRPADSLRDWDALTRTRPVVGLLAPDVHARIGLETLGEPYDRTTALRIPSYETMFRTATITVDGVALAGDPEEDAASVLTAIREGRLFSTIDAVASPGRVTLTARSGTHSAMAGGRLLLDGPVTVTVEAQAPSDATVRLYRDGSPIETTGGTRLEVARPAEPATYRAEIALPGAPGDPPVPWIVTNPVYVTATDVQPVAGVAPAAASTVTDLFVDEETSRANPERSPDSSVALDVVREAAGSGRQLLFRYAIGGRRSEDPYAAIAFPVVRVAEADRVVFMAHASHPMRLSVQLRAAGPEGEQRWQRSVYLDETPQTVTVPFNEMTGTGSGAESGPPALERVESLLLVVDTVNTSLGSNGQIWLDDLRLAK